MSKPQKVAIVGAGLSGLALALALDQQGMESIVYESRPEKHNIGGAVTLSPNALRVFDKLGVYDSIVALGYKFDELEFRNVDGKLIDTYEFGSQSKYGYSGNRIYRYELIDLLLDALSAKGVAVIYGKKLSKITSETADGVNFIFTDETTATANVLIGADGVHSTVRAHLYPAPEYASTFVGTVAVTAAIPASYIPAHLQPKLPITIMTPTHGALVLAPQKADGSEYLIGKQRRITTGTPANPTREEWIAINADKESSIDFLKKDSEVFGPLAVAATSCLTLPATNSTTTATTIATTTATTTPIDPQKINIWPFYLVPHLPTWTSTPHRRIILVGDAAHAIPPSAGQGVNQAMEDIYMLSLLLGAVTAAATGTAAAATTSISSAAAAAAKAAENSGEQITTQSALKFWQDFRQDRVNRVLDLVRQIEKRRMPPSSSPSSSPATSSAGSGDKQNDDVKEKTNEEKVWDLDWLYSVDIDKVVAEWIEKCLETKIEGNSRRYCTYLRYLVSRECA